MTALAGRVVAWSPVDALGRIEIASQEVLGFGRSACDFDPVVGVQVLVHTVAETPRGRRATRVSLASLAEHDAAMGARDDAERYAPYSDEALAAHLDDVRAVGLLACVLREPVPSRAALRDLFSRAGLALDLAQASGPALRLGAGRPLMVWIANARLGLQRVLAEGPAVSATGGALLTFAVHGPSLRTQRAEVLAGAQLRGARFDAWSAWQLGPLADAVARLALAADASAVVAAQAGLEAFTPSYFRQILGDVTREAWRPLAPFVGLAFDEGRRTVRTTGMAAFGLPDVLARLGPAADHDAGIQAVLATANDMVHRGLAIPADFEIHVRPVFAGGFPLDWDLLAPAPGALRWRVLEATADLVTLAAAG